MIPSSFFNVMALTVAAVALLSCGQDPSPAVQGTSLEPGNYCEAFFEPFCERQIGCNFALINQATSIEACLSEASRLCSPQLETYLDSLEVGNTTFDVDALSACRQEVKAANCRQLAAGLMPEACLKIFVGAAELGGECFTDVECVSGPTPPRRSSTASWGAAPRARAVSMASV